MYVSLGAQQLVVKERESDMPIPGVTLYNFQKSTFVITDANGEAALDDFEDDEVIYFQNILYKKRQLTKSQVSTNHFVVYLDLSINGLGEIVVSASKFRQNKKEVTQTIKTLSASDIAFATPQTSADALENTGHVFVQKSQLGGGSPMIRGFSTNRLLITVDGIRMNNAIFRSGNLQNVISIDPFSIQNTEVTLGAGSIVYGSDAIGGVMSFYTKKPQLTVQDSLFLKANAIARYASSNHEKTGHFDINLGLKNWGFLTSVSYSDFDDLRMGSHGPEAYLRPQFVETQNGEDLLVINNDPEVQTPTGFNQIYLMQKIHHSTAEDLQFDMGIHYASTSDYARYDRLIRPSGEGLRSAQWHYGPQRWFMGNLSVTKTSSRSNLYDNIKATVAYQNFAESRIDRDFASPMRRIREEQVNALSFNIDVEKQLSSKTHLFYGAEYVYNSVDSKAIETDIVTNTSTPTLTRYPDDATWQSLAAYSSIKYRPSETFVFQGGLRYNQVMSKANFDANNVFLNLPFSESEVNTNALTGSAGIRWIPNAIIEWNLNASTAFRAPNIDDIGKVFDSEPGAVVVPNNTLKPEYAYGVELGLKLNFDTIFSLDVATFYTLLDNALIRRDYMLNGETEIFYDGAISTVQAIQNESQERIHGFELGVLLNITPTLQLKSQYNVIGGTDESNGKSFPVRHVAPNFGRTHLIWNFNTWTLDAFAVYNNELRFEDLAPSEIRKDYLYARDDNGNPYSPAWYTLNLRSQYQVNTSLRATLHIENITDQRYRVYSSGIAAPGRNLIVSLNYSF